MRFGGAVGLADLLQALARDEPERAARQARLLGFEWSRPQERPIEIPAPELAREVERTAESETPQPAPAGRPKPIPFWRVVRVETLEEIEAAEAKIELVSSAAGPLTAEDLKREPLPEKTPIVPWSRLWPALLPLLRRVLHDLEIDVEALVESWSRGETVEDLPRRRSVAPTSRLVVLVDRSRRLMPIWGDQDLFIAELRRRLGDRSVRVVNARKARSSWPAGRHAPPVLGDVVLALSDLGAYGPPERGRQWLRFGRQLRRLGLEPAALCLCPRRRWRGGAFGLWRVIDWSAPLSRGRRIAPAPEEELEAQAERLLRLVAPAEWVEPGLLREIRQLLPAGEADVGTEVDAWHHRRVDGSSWLAMALASADAESWRESFATEPVTLRHGVIEALREWHGGSARETWVLEAQRLLALGAVPDGAMSGEEITQLVEFVDRAGDVGGEDDSLASSTRSWIRFNAGELPPALWKDDRLGAVWRRAWQASLPPGVKPESLPPGARLPESEGGEPRRWSVRQIGEQWELQPDPKQGGSWLASLLARRSITVDQGRGAWARRYELEPGLRIPMPTPLTRPEWAPEWASRVGEDRFGRWADLHVGEVVQRFRWIEPGTFWMGSPEDEEGRSDREGPRHRVTLTEGYWLGDTPCTQELWLEVMEKNPSRFQTPRRPVENVSWEDTQRFFEELEALAPGFAGRLPTEAEWEYACRAGTETATYAGDLEILGANNAPMLDEIAWYGGNSGVGFELENGVEPDGEWWKEKQYDFNKAGTREVATRRPNPRGLYDTLGNVWEWCADWYGDYELGESVDPQGPAKGALRVFRGGSWFGVARRVRAAARSRYDPSSRFVSLGFRLSRGQAPAQAAEPQQDGAADGGVPGEGRTGHPPASRLVLLASDVERVELRAFERPEWAASAGRDAYGLWASFEVKGARERLRWIPPGRFLMGSPDEEEGRRDNEGPQHLVTLSSGYWLAEAPCTQELWQAVTGENPSEFESQQRPVEQVSWNDCREFCERLGELTPGLEPRLPSEAEWEYACRAGTRTATWRGDLDILGANNAPLLDEIAWYGGNSGHEYDLEGGWASSGWPDKQYDHQKAGTRKVRLKAPNPWGLYDMLGNVWEWCADWYGPYDKEPLRDPAGPQEGTGRVIRGGSWFYAARHVRAAARRMLAPSHRYGYLGFRLSRGPAPARSADRERRRK